MRRIRDTRPAPLLTPKMLQLLAAGPWSVNETLNSMPEHTELVALWERHTRSLREFLASPGHRDEAQRMGIGARLEHARAELDRVSSPEYLKALVGTIGADPVHRPAQGRPEPRRSLESQKVTVSS